MALPVNNTVAAYFGPAAESLSDIENYQPRVCTIVSVGPTGLVCAVVQDPVTSGPYTRWVAENVPYIDGDIPLDEVPQYGGYVAPTGFTPPSPQPLDLSAVLTNSDLDGFDGADAPE